ncbi:MAG: hypothetical protein QOE28_3128 [Solirubrobacteraceae bacterium]|nr:hypothetical protein [Solirubrobacteraceae bacterium]
MPLLGRDGQLRQISAWLADAGTGRGQVVLVLAGAGLGKTSLLHEVRSRARATGVQVFAARGSELERDTSFGVTRQLFERHLASLDDAERANALRGAAELARSAVVAAGDAPASDRRGILHGLYWLAMNFAEREPVLLVVDDAHWADAETLRWLVYLAARLAGSRLLVVVAARPAEPAARRPLLETLAADDAVTVLGLDPLDRAAIGHLVSARLGATPDPAFLEACLAATGGNPFFVQEVLRAAVRDALEPGASNAGLVPQLSTSEAARSVRLRLARLGQPARRLAEALSVLAPAPEIRYAAQLCELPIDAALELTDVLADAGILHRSPPGEFIHPIARAAVQEQMSLRAQHRAHRCAAQMLADDGASPERVASHALACAPTGDAQVVVWLRSAAASALDSGGPDAAARYLRRALQEPPEESRRSRIHFELGRALAGVDVNGAAASFAEAAATATGAARVQAHRWEAQTLGFGGRPDAAVAALERAREAGDTDPDRALLIRATRDFFALAWIADPDGPERSRRLQLLASGLAGATPGERRALAVASLDIARTGSTSATRALELASRVRRALATWLDADDGVETAGAIGESSIISDDAEALARHDRAIAEATRRGMVTNAGAGFIQIAHIRFRRGALVGAEADARTSWQLLRNERDGAAAFHWWSLTQLVDVLTARGQLDEAAALADAGGLATEPFERVMTFVAPPGVPAVLGELALARGHIQEGIDILMEGGLWLERRGWANPALNPWRARVAPALAMAGRVEEARAIIEPAVRRARTFAAPWALGMTTRAAGVVAEGPRRLELLRDAIAVLAPAGCRLEQASALVELGAALRRDNRRGEAREQLASALEMADRCGAAPLATRAREELAASGAHPRRTMTSGPESLTASERRVADLAAAGRSNPEIAQTLFVTRKTVETHLGHAFAKLNIRSRRDLNDALGDVVDV